MRLCVWAGAWSLLLTLVLLTPLHIKADTFQPRERHYYIAAVEIDWNYSGSDTHGLGPTYKKVVFREYEEDFRQAKTHPSWLGLLGPTIRAEEGETIVVTFRNMANGLYSIHPHGIAYGKQSEGANYFDNTSQKEKEDDVVWPHSKHVYYWEVTSDVSPQPNDPNCLTYTYVSHQNVVEDYNSGLIGALLICKPGSLNESGEQADIHQELVFLFGVFDEKESKYKQHEPASDSHVKYTINGYTKGSLPDISVCAYASVSLHLIGMSSQPEVFSVHVNGQVLQQMGHKVSSVGLISGSTSTASMVALHTGRWLLSSHIVKHMEAGMHGFVDVKKCDAFRAPRRRMTIAQKRESREWIYYIAAEEIVWDYAPKMHEHIDEDYKFQYLKQSSTRIGGRYKKAVYTLYKNESFTERSENKQRKNELGILGPVIRAQIRDVIKVVFKNMASRPYSIYPHGLTIEKSEEGVNYPAGGNQSHGVQPGETHTYVWRVVDEDEPLDGDAQCLTRLYHSAVDTARDIASGLIGPILICKSQSLNVKNVQLKADKEQHAVFTVFDENKSWYLDENIRQFSDRSKVNKADIDFYKYNVMHTINGYAFESGPCLGFCNGEVATWHVSSIGAQDYIQTATFYGHPFELNSRTEDFLSLYPMTGETIAMNMDNIGVWLLASLNSHGTTKGMRLRFQDVECFRDYEFEYNYEEEDPFRQWKPPSLDDIKTEEEKPKRKEEIPEEIDDYTLMFADELGLRSLKNQSTSSDADILDLSFLKDYDVLAEDTDIITLNFSSTTNETKSKNETFIPKPNPVNETLLSNMKELDGVNLTAVNLLNQSQFEYNYEDKDPFKQWKPPSLDDIKTEEEKPKRKEEIPEEIDDYTLMFADELGLRSLKNQSTSSDADILDLSVLKYDDVLPDDTDIITLNFSSYTNETKSKNETFIPKPNPVNETLLSNMKELDGVNLTAVNLLNQSQFEYNYEDKDPFRQWKPPSLDDIKTEEEKPKRKEEIPEVIDDYTLMFADELGLRSLKNQSTSSDADILDLSVLKYDDVLPDDTDIITLNFSPTNNETKSKNETFILKPNPVNETLLSNMKELDGVNLTAVNLLNQSIENAASFSDNSSVSKIGNTTSPDVFLKNDNITLNSSAPPFGNHDNVTASETENSTLDDMASLMVGNVSTDMTDRNVTLPGNLTSISEAERVNETQSGDNETSVDTNSMEESEESLTRGDVFFYSVPLSPSRTNDLNSTTERNVPSPSTSTKKENVNDTATNHVTMSDGTNHSMSVPMPNVRELNISSVDGHNVTIFELEVESRGNTTSVNDTPTTRAELEYGHQMNSSEIVNLSLENVTRILHKTVPLQNVTVNISKSNSSGEISSEIWQNVTALLDQSNHTSVKSFSNETMVSGNLSLSSHSFTESSSEELSASSEEVYIYLQANNTEVIKTTSLKTQDHNWTYEGTPQTVPMEMPDHMSKYLGKVTPVPKRKPKIRKMNYRHRPMKGQGMKTKKKKEYKPQVKTSLPFSPRGFNPGMTPRGSRPNSSQYLFDQEELINLPVVIGVSRPDFSDYELYVPGNEPDHLGRDEQDVSANEYEYVSYKDPYSSHEDIKNLNLYEDAKDPRRLGAKTYFISAEEVEWDYAGYGQRRENKFGKNSRETKFIKVVFRSYIDGHFRTPDIRGEMDEHLGILGPVIKAEVGQTIMVVFRNNANRPYSLHPNGVSYTKYTEGLSYEDGSKYWHKYDNEVQPNTTFTYIWKVNPTVGPMTDESQCRTWAYYSGVNPERDIHSGLIGPLLVCRKGTLDNKVTNTREFTLLFMTFDESQSWYYEMNHKMMQRKNRRRILDLKENLKFHSINGIIYNLKGLRMYTNQLVRWHLINMGSPRDFQSVHFHGQTFLHKKISNYRHAIYPLLPGSFATLEMYPSKPGLWQLETEVGFNQQQGMQTLFLVIDNDCYRTLGLESGSVKDKQIRASNTRGYWMPHFARLNNQGKYNAWSTEQNNSWIEVDFQRPVVISQVATQGAKQLFHSQYVLKYSISYSNDRWKWIFYKGDSIHIRKVFAGNEDAYATKTNTFFPPMIGRYIRLHPITWYNTATVRMEFYGCELDGCSVPLGMESGLIKDSHITASSTANSWYSGTWKPSLARLNRQGTVNAWQAKFNDMNQWLQVELPQIKKITGIITQGAKSLGREMYVKSYTLVYSDDGIRWKQYTDVDDVTFKTFIGNTDNNEHVKNYIHPPIFSRFIRIIPQSWKGTITMRIELLGCDFE